MTPGARIAAAAELLDDILDGSPAERALTRWARRSRFAGSKDRAAVRDLVFDALRCRRSLAIRGGAATGRGLMIGLLREAGQDPATLFTGEGHAPAPLTEAERDAGGEPAGADALDLPDWLVPLFEEALGPGHAEAALTLRHRAPTFLRVNLRKASVAEASAALSSAGIVTRPHPLADTALEVVEGARAIAGSVPYRDGLVELQDAASQAVCTSIPVRNGLTVLDYCAGGGGKTLALAGRAEGVFTCHDLNAQRLKDIPARADRAGVTVRIAGREDVARQAPYDLVLCDVPCSGSGAWRRSPEGKWSLTPSALDALNDIQDGILAEAARLVARDGVLAYATCSVLRSENEARVARFLAATPGWRCTTERRIGLDAGGDGFYLALLDRA